MHLSAMSYSKMREPAKLSDFLNKDFLIEMILVYTCVLFSTATENRFICHKKLDLGKEKNELIGPIRQITRTFKLQQNENFQQSEVYHFKAIEILCTFVEDCP